MKQIRCDPTPHMSSPPDLPLKAQTLVKNKNKKTFKKPSKNRLTFKPLHLLLSVS